MGYKQIYVLVRGHLEEDPAEVFHPEAFGGMGRGSMEDPSFATRFNIIGMDVKTVTVQEKDETIQEKDKNIS